MALLFHPIVGQSTNILSQSSSRYLTHLPTTKCRILNLAVSVASREGFLSRRTVGIRRSCARVFTEKVTDEVDPETVDVSLGKLSCVMKFGGSSVASAERMREVAQLILSFPEEDPVIVLSAMGKTTNKLLAAGETAVCCGVSRVRTIDELNAIKELHLKTIHELGLDKSIISELLEEMEQLLTGIALMKEMTPRTRDYLVSFGERMSTRIFAAYLNKIGAKARQVCQYVGQFIEK